MHKVRTSLLDTKCSREVKLSLVVAIKDLDTKINRFSQKILQYQKIESTWNTDYWDTPTWKFGSSSSLASNKLRHLCTFANVKITSCLYQSKQTPKWQISKGHVQFQLRSPVSFAIQHSTDNIYVSDCNGMRVQVFSPEGECRYFFNVHNNGPLKVFSVFQNIFAYNTKENAIFEFDDNSMKNCSTKYSCNMSLKKVIPSLHGNYYSIREYTENTCSTGNCTGEGNNLHQTLSVLCEPPKAFQWNRSILGTSAQASSFQSVTLKESKSNFKNVTLKESKSISLNITPVDIAIYQNSIFLLSSEGGDLVYEFNLGFALVRSFFSCSTMKRPLAMCVDREGNIIVVGDKVLDSDSHSDQYSITTPPINQSEITKLFVLSQEGDVIIHEMDIPCKNCIGVAVNSKFDIFLLNKDDKYVLSSL